MQMRPPPAMPRPGAPPTAPGSTQGTAPSAPGQGTPGNEPSFVNMLRTMLSQAVSCIPVVIYANSLGVFFSTLVLTNLNE